MKELPKQGCHNCQWFDRPHGQAGYCAADNYRLAWEWETCDKQKPARVSAELKKASDL